MSERAALYTVTVRPRGRGGQPTALGDIDGKGSSVRDVLASVLDGFSETSADGSRVARALLVEPDGEELFTIIQHGQNGLAADIVDASGGVRLRQTPDDVQLVRCGCLFRLPVAATVGSLAVHVSNGRGIKGLVVQGLVARFGSAFPQLRLAIERLADPGALHEAVAADRIEKLRLVRLEPAGKRPADETGKWVDAAAEARLELDLAVRTPGHRIQRDLIERYLAGETDAFAEIVSFAGMTFDEALVGVVLPDETRRLFDLARPEAGRPMTRELPSLDLDADGEPTAASLLAGLQTVLAGAGKEPAAQLR
ncbi:MAG TPA: hypothetical protein VH063_01515 [Gaiellaceae bacterium]|nr:hypothetical protein [Gaiellaceae bacterium]